MGTCHNHSLVEFIISDPRLDNPIIKESTYNLFHPLQIQVLTSIRHEPHLTKNSISIHLGPRFF